MGTPIDARAGGTARRSVLIALLLTLAWTGATAPPASAGPFDAVPWQELGPRPIPGGIASEYTQPWPVSGRLNDVVVDPLNANLIYVAADGGGVFRSRDGGTTWKALTDGQDAFPVNELELAQDGTLWAGTGTDTAPGAGLYRISNPNDDATLSVTVVGRNEMYGLTVTGIVLDPAFPDRVIVASRFFSDAFQGPAASPGLYLSENASSPTPTLTKVAGTTRMDSVNGEGITDAIGLATASNQCALIYALSGKTTAGDYFNGVYKAFDNDLFTPGCQFAFKIVLGLSPFDGGNTYLGRSGSTVYLSTDDDVGTVFKSTNGGETFTKLTSASGWGVGRHTGGVGVDPTDPDNVFLGGAYSCYRACGNGFRVALRSLDGGATFLMADGPYTLRGGIVTSSIHPDTTAITFAPSNPDIVYLAGDGGLYRTSAGRTEEVDPDEAGLANVPWESKSTPSLGTVQFYGLAVHPIDPDYTIGGTQDNGAVLYDPTGNRHWPYVGLGGDSFTAIISHKSEDVDRTTALIDCERYTSTADMITKDQTGSVWCTKGTHAEQDRSDKSYYGIAPRLTGNYTFGPLAEGATNRRITSNTPTSFAVSPHVLTLGLAGFPQGNLHRIDLSGSAHNPPFTQVRGPWPDKPVTAIAFSPTDPDVAVIGLGHYGDSAFSRIYQTTNLSATTPTWTVAATGLPNVAIRSLVIDRQNPDHLYVGTDSGVFHGSRPAGSTGAFSIEPMGQGIPRGCAAAADVPCPYKAQIWGPRSMAIPAGKRVLRIATFGRGMWEIPLTAVPATISKPSIGAATLAPANEYGWRKPPVAISWSCTKGGAPLDAPTVSKLLVTSAAGQTATGYCRDVVGNFAKNSIANLDIDGIAPAIDGSLVSDPNENGWYKAPVTIEWVCEDGLSGLAVGGTELQLNAEGADQGSAHTCVDKAGNSSEASELTGINIDLTPPAIGPAERPAANADGWYREPVTVTWPCEDELSGPVSATVSVTIAGEGADQQAVGRCVDRAGNDREGPEEDIDIDRTAPEIALANRPAPNAHGWYREPVTITWSCADALSGAEQAAVEHTTQSEGRGVSVEGTCTDRAGNTSSATEGALDIDRTPPRVAFVEHPGTYPDTGRIEIACTASDDLSGVPQPCPGFSVDAASLPLGENVATVTVEDAAGNAATAATRFTITRAATVVPAPTGPLPGNNPLTQPPMPFALELPRSGKADRRTGKLTLKLALPATGSLKVTEVRRRKRGRRVPALISRPVVRLSGTSATVTLRPTRATLRKLRAGARRKRTARVSVRVQVTFTPAAGGAAVTAVRTYRLETRRAGR